jgi:hypothetical protein
MEQHGGGEVVGGVGAVLHPRELGAVTIGGASESEMTLAEQEQEQQQHSFPFVLHGILRTTSPDIITWTSKGRAFGIKDMKVGALGVA